LERVGGESRRAGRLFAFVGFVGEEEEDADDGEDGESGESDVGVADPAHV